MKSDAPALDYLEAVESHPVRGGWIEILLSVVFLILGEVPPRAGWVD